MKRLEISIEESNKPPGLFLKSIISESRLPSFLSTKSAMIFSTTSAVGLWN